MRAYLVLLLCPWAAAVAVATAASDPAQPGLLTVVTNSSVSMDQAVQMVEQRYHARVVKAQTQKDAGRTVYVLRLLNDSGRVWTVRVDAASGSIL